MPDCLHRRFVSRLVPTRVGIFLLNVIVYMVCLGLVASTLSFSMCILHHLVVTDTIQPTPYTEGPLRLHPPLTDNRQGLQHLYHLHDVVENGRSLPPGHTMLTTSSDKRCRWMVLDSGTGIRYIVVCSTAVNMLMFDNLDVRLLHHPLLGAVHTGYARRFDAILGCLIPWLSTGFEQLVLFGHSLGGAVVTLLTTYLYQFHIDLRPKIVAVASGTPRVYSENRARDVSKLLEGTDTLTMIRNHSDLVTVFPLSVTLLPVYTSFSYGSLKVPTISFDIHAETLAACHSSDTYHHMLTRHPQCHH